MTSSSSGPPPRRGCWPRDGSRARGEAEVDKLERLLNLTIALLDTARPLSAEELRRRVPGYPDGAEAFHRAFERDKDDLREMGIPVRLAPIPGTDPPLDGYRIRSDEYYLDDPGLAPDELAALHLAATAVRVDDLQGVEGLWKLGGLVDGGETAAPVTELPGDPRLAELFAAVTDRSPVSFDYRGERRTVEPYRIDFQRGRWYLTGHDRDREDERNFRVDRIEGGIEVGEAQGFERPADAVPGRARQPWEFGEGEAVRARIVVDHDQALAARRHLGDESVVREHDDGAVEFDVDVVNPDAFRTFVLTFLEHAEVLEPETLRADLVAWLEDVAS